MTIDLGRDGARLSLVGLLVLIPATASSQRRFGPPVAEDSGITTMASRVYELERLVKRSPNDAIRWHELGLLAWGLEPSVLAGNLPLENPFRLSRVADYALQTAAMIDAKNVRYQLLAANRLLASNIATSRTGAKKYFLRGVQAARASSDKSLLAAAALEYGRTFWWHFDATEHRHRFVSTVAPRSLADAMQPLARGAKTLEEMGRFLLAQEYAMLVGKDPVTGKSVDFMKLSPVEVDNILTNTQADEQQFMNLPKGSFKSVRELLTANSHPLPKDLSGWTDFEEAAKLFHEAYRADPGYPGAFRAIAIAYASQNLWANLERAATKHIVTFPRDSLAWLALGLARYRAGSVPAARRAFDSALVLLGPAERKRLDNWRRVTPPNREFMGLAGGKAMDQDMFWKVANPLWADSAHDARLEFLSRLTYAELRWTVEEFDLPGADTDRGNVYVRYGPPNKTFGFGTAFSDDALDVVQFWLYDNGLIFAFSGMPTFGTMRLPPDDVAMVDELSRLYPVRWDNVGAPAVDSLRASSARFRAGPDSLDVALAVDYLTPDSIASTMSVAGSVKRHLWIISAGAGSERHLTGTLATAGTHLWQTRVAPGTMVYRAEASAESATRGQRATGIINALTPDFPLSGLGISDLLIARSVGTSPPPPLRWSDVSLVPSTGAISRGDPLTILWENYEFGSREGRAEYDVTLTLNAEMGKGARIRAEILGALAVLARTDVAPDRVTFTFSRSTAHAAAFVDWVTVSIPDAPKGTYTVTLDVIDRGSGKRVSRATTIKIRD